VRIAVVALLAAGLIAGLGCGKAPATGVSVEPAFRSAIPKNTKALLSIQIEKLKATELYKRHQTEFDLPQLDALAERVGLDPRRDLTALLLAWDGDKALVLARGSFAPAELGRKLGAMGIPRFSYKKYTLFGEGKDAVVFVDKGLALAAPADSLRTVLDLRDNGDGGVPDELRQRLPSIAKSALIWEVSRGGLPFANIALRSDLQSALANIAGYVSDTTFSLGVDSGAQLHAEITCVSNEGAQRVHDAMRGMIGLGRLTTNESNLDLLRMWDAISVQQNQQVIRVRADLPPDLTDKLLAYLPSLRSRAGQMLNR
jgi:hypothetical protein